MKLPRRAFLHLAAGAAALPAASGIASPQSRPTGQPSGRFGYAVYRSEGPPRHPPAQPDGDHGHQAEGDQRLDQDRLKSAVTAGVYRFGELLHGLGEAQVLRRRPLVPSAEQHVTRRRLYHLLRT